ncbi:hypothetical protein CAPTEDRAFT_176783 [Capitella teleta]|uniref:Frizzled-4 n=1 Tax=Capitella teleta TaxID=283909 RepID=R7ULU7_CAPTE|nr:hypothetical protein CAPTEDRAFT_176783 [Capitella teleta]|eukprot:ELU07504.1 hypothetical protein CAPTEDRAFT_176783 [Capitella teleta]
MQHVLASLLLVSYVIAADGYQHSITYGRCERITIPMCRDMRYNMTRMPNLIGHTSQKDAEQQIREFIPLVQIRCSKLVKFFLCSLYAPMCTEQVDETLVVPACRSMCLEVKSKCEPIMTRFSFNWPSVLDCSKLPLKSDRTNLCMDAPNMDEPELASDDAYLSGGVTPNAECSTPSGMVQSGKGPTCSERFVYVEKPGNNQTCSPRCNMDVYFRQEDKKFAEVWMLVWASLCLASTLVTVLTFLIDSTRFKYPERPIIFLSMCYTIYSLAYLARAFLGPDTIACDSNKHGEKFIIQEGLESTWCILVFLVLYFFGMASSIWWVVLTLTWYLAAGRKWGREAIQSLSSYFHLAAWAVPAIKTIVILTMRRVDGDELTGLCYVGNQDQSALVGFVLVPLFAYLFIGTAFILAGFLAMFRIRHNLKQDGTNIRKLEQLMAKLGVFSVLYTVPATCVIGCHLYEHMNSDHWRQQAMQKDCRIGRTGPKAGQLDCSLDASIPTVEVYMLKIFMSMVVGITSGMWVWSSKSLSSWNNFICGTVLNRKATHATKMQQPHAGSPPKTIIAPAQGAPPRSQIYYQQCASDMASPLPSLGQPVARL